MQMAPYIQKDSQSPHVKHRGKRQHKISSGRLKLYNEQQITYFYTMECLKFW